MSGTSESRKRGGSIIEASNSGTPSKPKPFKTAKDVSGQKPSQSQPVVYKIVQAPSNKMPNNQAINATSGSVTAIQATSFESRIMLLKLEKMDKHFEKLSAIEKSVAELTHSVEFMNKGFEDIREETRVFKEDIMDISQKLKIVVAAQQEEAEQKSRGDTIRIVGIAEDKDENCEGKVLTVLTEIVPVITQSDISIAHRIGRRGDPNRAIVVTL